MKAMAEFFFSFLKNKNREEIDKADFIFYKIVDFKEDTEEYVLQCINTKACFNLKLITLVFDIDILYGLHPVQSCYLGIECGKNTTKFSDAPDMQTKLQKKLESYPTQRYGEYELIYKNREKNLCFINKVQEEFIMDPRDIALSAELISEFDAAQAFFIGYEAGKKMNNPTHRPEVHAFRPPYYLRIVK